MDAFGGKLGVKKQTLVPTLGHTLLPRNCNLTRGSFWWFDRVLRIVVTDDLEILIETPHTARVRFFAFSFPSSAKKMYLFPAHHVLSIGLNAERNKEKTGKPSTICRKQNGKTKKTNDLNGEETMTRFNDSTWRTKSKNG